jgi:hypothetical protein
LRSSSSLAFYADYCWVFYWFSWIFVCLFVCLLGTCLSPKLSFAQSKRKHLACVVKLGVIYKFLVPEWYQVAYQTMSSSQCLKHQESLQNVCPLLITSKKGALVLRQHWFPTAWFSDSRSLDQLVGGRKGVKNWQL